jgi:hypothetical protein
VRFGEVLLDAVHRVLPDAGFLASRPRSGASERGGLRYVADGEREGDTELAEFFRKVQE